MQLFPGSENVVCVAQIGCRSAGASHTVLAAQQVVIHGVLQLKFPAKTPQVRSSHYRIYAAEGVVSFAANRTIQDYKVVSDSFTGGDGTCDVISDRVSQILICHASTFLLKSFQTAGSTAGRIRFLRRSRNQRPGTDLL